MEKQIEVLYESHSYVVCYKPAGMLSQQGKPGQMNMLAVLSMQMGGEFFPVHRLDKETSGVMVYARTQAAAAKLSREIQQGSMKKEYLAVVHGAPEDSGTMEDLLLHDVKRNKSYVVDRKRGGVKSAKLAFHVLARQNEKALVQVRLFTGRTHQIRVQFSSRGVPLYGDGKYGGGSGKLALSSVRLGFHDPDNGRWMVFTRLPEELGGFASIPDLYSME